MALNYRSVDRDQSYLLPPDMRDWLPSHHLSWFLLEVVAALDTSSLHGSSKRARTGRAGYDPDMLFGVYLYACARGISSSRQIERLCSEDVAFRVMCGQDVPDHTVLARFRQRHEAAMTTLFARVLELCVENGLGKFGVIAIDGTKVKANASSSRSRSLKGLRKLAAAEFAKAAATDAAEDAALVASASEDIPVGMGPGPDRAARIRAAITDLEAVIEADSKPTIEKFETRLAQAQERLAAEQARKAAGHAKYVKAAKAAAVSGKKLPGRAASLEGQRLDSRRRGVEYAHELLDRARKGAADRAAGELGRTKTVLLQRNTTDPQARIMHTRSGFITGYNVQIACADDQLILVAEATDEVNDKRQAIPMMNKVEAAVTRCREVSDRTDLVVGTVLFDNGYLSAENVAADGYDRLIAPGRGVMKDGQWSGKFRGEGNGKPDKIAQAMIEKLQEPANQVLYKRRAVLVEPVNGHLKDRRGLRQFSRRGKDAINAEVKLAAMTTNLMKLFTTVWQPERIAG